MSITKLRALLRGRNAFAVPLTAFYMLSRTRRNRQCAAVAVFAFAIGAAGLFHLHQKTSIVETTPAKVKMEYSLQNSAAPAYTISNLETPPDIESSGAADINNNGLVVGTLYIPGTAGLRAVCWRDGKIQRLDDRGSGASALNDKGQIVGGSQYACMWDKGKMIQIGETTGGQSDASAINAQGQVVGQACVRGQKWVGAFLWQNGAIEGLGTLPGGNMSSAAGINNKGQIVGSSSNAESRGNYAVIHAFLWDRTSGMRDLGTLEGGDLSYAYAVNDQGQVVGKAARGVGQGTGQRDKPFLWQNGVMQDLGSLRPDKAARGIAKAINNKTEIVGYEEYAGDTRAWIWRKGKIYDLNLCIPADSGWKLTMAHGINDKGQIVGIGKLAGQYRAFLLTPVNR